MNGSLESMVIGEQAKNLREYANLSLEDVAERMKLTVGDLKNYENGELYSMDVIQNFFLQYLQVIELIHIEKNKSFVGFLNNYCKSNDLDYDSFQLNYYDSIANRLVDQANKQSLNDIAKEYVRSASVKTEFNINMNRMLELGEKATKIAESSTENVNVWIERYEKTHDAAIKKSDMLDILLDVVTSDSQYMKNKIIRMVKEEMNLWIDEVGEDEEFPQYQKASYVQLIHELKTRWDFIESK